jgi:hypothetical protein
MAMMQGIVCSCEYICDKGVSNNWKLSRQLAYQSDWKAMANKRFVVEYKCLGLKHICYPTI